MDLKKIIKEVTDDWSWAKEITTYPTLQELFNAGEISENDVLVLRGNIAHGVDDTKTWTNDFTVIIDSLGDTLEGTLFDIPEEEEEAVTNMGINDYLSIAFLNSDGELEVVSKNGQRLNLTESTEDSWDWVKEESKIPLIDYIDATGIREKDYHKLVNLKVEINPKSEFYEETLWYLKHNPDMDITLSSNPIGVQGVIDSSYIEVDKSLPLMVLWDNGELNSYAPHDLDVIL